MEITISPEELVNGGMSETISIKLSTPSARMGMSSYQTSYHTPIWICSAKRWMRIYTH